MIGPSMESSTELVNAFGHSEFYRDLLVIEGCDERCMDQDRLPHGVFAAIVVVAIAAGVLIAVLEWYW
jgi:hypothetical protein